MFHKEPANSQKRTAPYKQMSSSGGLGYSYLEGQAKLVCILITTYNASKPNKQPLFSHLLSPPDPSRG